MLGVVSSTRFSSSSAANPIRFFNNNHNKSHTSTRLRAVSSISEFPLASKIVVTNLSHSTSDAVLKKKFSNFGQVVEEVKRVCFIQYTCQDDAVLALESMDRKYIEGRLVYVDIAKPVTSTFGAYPRTSGPPKEQTS
ncbi:hypothetical protein MKW92_052048 [Papaver armeniacum]|nr:hypothetical protein MKW92_052048 [Papaver armeniacum]